MTNGRKTHLVFHSSFVILLLLPANEQASAEGWVRGKECVKQDLARSVKDGQLGGGCHTGAGKEGGAALAVAVRRPHPDAARGRRVAGEETRQQRQVVAAEGLDVRR